MPVDVDGGQRAYEGTDWVPPMPVRTGIGRGRVLLWRRDSKRWEIGTVKKEYVGKAEYAYSHWLPLPNPPRAR